MHFFELKDFQDIVSYWFPGFIAVFLIAAGLGYVHFRTRASEEKRKRPHHTFPGGIQGADEPVPLVVIFIIAGTVVWGFFYILAIALSGVKI